MATGLSTALNNSRVKADCVHLFAIPQYLVGIRLKPYTNRKEKNMKKSVFFIVAHQINFMDVLLGGKTRKTERLVLNILLFSLFTLSLYRDACILSSKISNFINLFYKYKHHCQTLVKLDKVLYYISSS